MKQEMQIEILKELINKLDNHTTVDAGSIVINPVSSYTCKVRAAREREAFFDNHPQVLGFSGELPRPGSYMTTSDFGIPILATRDNDGKFHAFINACRHRGAQLTAEARGEQGRFSCPFHAWTYANDGRLLGVREAGQFGSIDKSCHSLIELPAEEKYGLLFIHPQRDGKLEVDALLGDVAGELAAWEFERCEYLGESVLDMPLNWKIANDTFGEVYHFQSLHKDTLSNLFHGDAASYTEFGRHHRIVVASRYIDTMRTLPEAQWNLSSASITAYYLFPNVQIVIFNGVIALIRIYPDKDNPGQSLSRVAHYGAPHIGTQVVDPEHQLSGENVYQARADAPLALNLATQLELFVSTVEHEDYAMGVRTQIAANSGKLDHFLFGRNEPALHHFHNNYREALGEAPLEAYQDG